MAFCTKCGTQVAADAAFCGSCGTATSASVKSLPAQPSAPISLENSPVGTLIETFCREYSGEKSKNIWSGNSIPAEYLEKHKREYLKLNQNERVLILLNKGGPLGGVFTGLAITDQRIHFCTLEKSFFSGLVPWFFAGPKGNLVIEKLNSIEIAEHDTCFGTGYVGHELRIDDKVPGYVRMGTGIELDEFAIKYLNALFDYLADNSILKRRVNQYNWQ
jgi:hypothetical protein